jgi:cytochrome c1
MATFKYDVVTLIELVESKPALWDKTNDNNKNKILRDKNWQEIINYLDDGYEQQTQAERKKTGGWIYFFYLFKKCRMVF